MDTISDCVIKHELDQMDLYFLLVYVVQSKTMGHIKLCKYIYVDAVDGPVGHCKVLNDCAV